MISETIRTLRTDSGLSQAELARKLSITRASVNAWEMGLSSPTAQYIIELSKLFHCTTDFLLGLDNKKIVDISKYNKEETKLIRDLISYIDSNSNK